MKAMASNKKNKSNQQNDPVEKSISENEKIIIQNQEEIPDSFSEALLGTHSDLPAARLPNERGQATSTAQVGENTQSAMKPEIPPRGDFLDSAYPENILTSITQAHSSQEPIALPQEKERILLPEHIEQNPQKSSLPALVLLTAVIISYLIGYGGYYTNNNGNDAARKITTDQNNPFLNISLEAKAAYVYDVNSQKTLFALNENGVLPLASLTKLMTAVIASELLPSGTVVTVGKTDIENEGDSGLFINERWKLSDIIGFTLMTSSNDGASALAAAAGSLGQNAYGEPTEESKRKFVDAMNTKAETLGLRGTHFFNESGLDVDGEISGGYGTARDVALLMAHVVKIAYRNIESTTLVRTTMTSLDNIRHHATNTNEAINTIPGVIASKTGYTDLAGGNLAIAFDAGLSHPVVVVVLGSTREGRFKDAEALTWAALEELKRK